MKAIARILVTETPDGPYETEEELDETGFDGDEEIEQDESDDPGPGGNMGTEESKE